MLAAATLELARRNGGTALRAVTPSPAAVSVIARRRDRLQALATAAAGAIHPIPLDYHDTPALAAALRTAIAERGPIDLAVCWVHSTAPDAIPTMAECLAEAAREVRLFHIVGTGSDDQPDHVGQIQSRIRQIPGVLYRKVQLGFIVEAGRSRWLTHEEISRGVIEAIDTDADESVVGAISPTERMPR